LLKRKIERKRKKEMEKSSEKEEGMRKETIFTNQKIPLYFCDTL